MATTIVKNIIRARFVPVAVVAAVVGAGVLGTFVHASRASASHGADRLLCTWYHDGLGDHFTTTTGCTSGTAPGPGYRFMREEGRILLPSVTPRPGEVKLWSWWSKSRGDHFTTTAPEWDPAIPKSAAPHRGDYVIKAFEGWIWTTSAAASAQGCDARKLSNWWSGERMDNYATTDQAWQGTIPPVPHGNYYKFNVEGFIRGVFSCSY